MRKSRFFAFLCAFVPGAGQMYLGFMKRGISIMMSFVLLTCLAGWLRIPLLAVPLPVIWFYSFFDTLNLRNTPFGQLELLEDRYLFDLGGISGWRWSEFLGKRHVVIGGICIFLGLYMILDNFLYPILSWLDFHWLIRVVGNLPTLAVAFAIIYLGLYLIKGSPKIPRSDEDYDNFKEFHSTGDYGTGRPTQTSSGPVNPQEYYSNGFQDIGPAPQAPNPPAAPQDAAAASKEAETKADRYMELIRQSRKEAAATPTLTLDPDGTEQDVSSEEGGIPVQEEEEKREDREQ